MVLVCLIAARVRTGWFEGKILEVGDAGKQMWTNIAYNDGTASEWRHAVRHKIVYKVISVHVPVPICARRTQRFGPN